MAAGQLTLANPKVQRLRRLLGRRSARSDEGAFGVEGASNVAQAIEHGWPVEALFLAAGTVPESLGLPEAIATSAVAVFELAPGVMEKVATTETPPAVIAVVGLRRAGLDQLATASFVVVGDRIADPGNAGTLLRSAEAAGADAVVLTAGSVDAFNPKVVRSSAGALFAVPVITDVSLADVGGVAGLQVLGATSHLDHQRAAAYTDVDLTGRVALVVGNEAHGLDPAAVVDAWITIPHAGRAESLNVAMAATVLAFEVARQRRAAAGSV